MKALYTSVPTLFFKLIFSGLLALILVACSSSSSSSSSSSPNVDKAIKFDFTKSNVTVTYSPGLTATNTISVKNVATGQIRYESDTSSVATVDGNGALSIQGSGYSDHYSDA